MFSRDKKARERIEEMERRLDKMEVDQRMLKLEWEEAYEKIATTLRKLGKRAEMLQKEMDGGRAPLSPEEEALRDNMSDAPDAPKVIPRSQAEAAAIVMKRRAGRA